MRSCALCSFVALLAAAVSASACPEGPARLLDHHYEHLVARQAPPPGRDAVSTSAATSSSSLSSGSSSSTVTGSSSLPPGYSMPKAFDAILGVNFTSTTCPDFFSSFLEDELFSSCYPLSLLLETSTSFFQTMRNVTVLPAVLDQMCAVDEGACGTKMDQLASSIVKNDACGRDLSEGNALAVSALNGFQNFLAMYKVGCLKDPASKQYCFAEAANATSAGDLYLYYIAGGTGLPSGTRPSCNTCSKSVMSAYSDFASNSTMRLSQTYSPARNALAVTCGPSFAPMVAATTTTGSASSQKIQLGILFLPTLLCALLALL